MPSCRNVWVVIAFLALAYSTGATGVDGPTLPAADEQALKAAGLTPTPAGLLDFLRKRTPADVSEKALADLMRQLADRTPEAHNKAIGELVAYGHASIPMLRQAANDVDHPETIERARRCLELIQGSEGPSLISAAVRSLAVFKPTGAAEALLNYYPFADDERVAEEVTQALLAVAVRDGKPEPALLSALEQPPASRRVVAASVVCQTASAEQRSVVRKLLHDPVTTVRLRAALSLAQAHDGEAVPVLIDLLAELPPEQTQPIEEFLGRLAGEWALTVPAGNDEVARRLRRDLWTAWWRSTEGPGLLEQFKKRTPSDADREKIATLVRQLDDVSPAAREKAIAEILTLGNVAVPLLRQTAGNANSPIRERAQKCLELMNRNDFAPLPAVAARLIAVRKPEGAAAALLAYLPMAEDSNMGSEIQSALTALSIRNGKPEPALIQALGDKASLRRTVAAEALCRSGLQEPLQLVRKLLDDPETSVRLSTALALIAAKDRQAVTSLIGLLPKLTPEEGARAEGFLRSLAGDKAPEIVLGTDAAALQRSHDAWLAWWRENGHTVDLAKQDGSQRMLGFTLVVEQYSQSRRSGRVSELGQNGKLRWEILGLQGPFDAQVVPGDRVLIVEQGISRVSERDFKNNITWQRQINLPQCVQRLPNGNTFIAARGQLLELDRNQKEVFSYPRPQNDIMTAQKLPDGQIAFLTYSWTYVRLDAKGKEQKSFRVGPFQFFTNSIQLLPGDRVLVPDLNANRVVEINAEGKRLWEASVPMPSGVQRMPNGNTLVSSTNGQRIVELNRAGKVVWEHKETFNPWRAIRR